MAIQKGPIIIQGKMQGYYGCKTSRGWELRKIPDISKDRIMSSPVYVRTRENMAEFSHAAKAAKTFRHAFRSALCDVWDGSISNRSVSAIRNVIKSDCTSQRGQRNIFDGNICLLNSFQFNKHSELPSVIMGNYYASFDRVFGSATGTVDSFTPCSSLNYPESCTHFRLFTAAALLDFASGLSEGNVCYSPILPINSTRVDTTVMQVTLSPNSCLPAAVVMGIEFFSTINGTMHIAAVGNAAQVVKVEKA